MNYQALLRMILPFMVLSAVVGAAAYGTPDWVLLASILTIGILPLAYVASLFALPFIVRARQNRTPDLAEVRSSQTVITITINVLVAAIMIAAVRVRMMNALYLAMGV